MIDYTTKLKDAKKIYGTRITLRPFLLSDAQAMYDYASDEEVTKFLSFSPHQNLEETEKTLTDFFIDKPGIYAIEENTTKEVIGCIDIRVTERGRATFGYVLAQKYWNNGYMTEALKLLLELAFYTLQLDAVYSVHYFENPASGYVMEKAGMHYVGVLRNGFVGQDGKAWDCKLYNITKEEYEIQKLNISELDTLRDQINGLDLQLTSILEKRFETTKKVGLYKKGINMPILDSSREKMVLDKIEKLLEKETDKNKILSVIQELLKQSKLQQKELIDDEM